MDNNKLLLDQSITYYKCFLEDPLGYNYYFTGSTNDCNEWLEEHKKEGHFDGIINLDLECFFLEYNKNSMFG